MNTIYKNLFQWGACILLFLGTSPLLAQTGLSEPFQVTWNFNGVKSGVSNSSNFQAQDATFGSQVFDEGYVPVEGTNQALVAQNWPDQIDPQHYLEFQFTPLEYEFDLNTVTARLKRSTNGPRQFTVSITITKFKSTEDSLTYNAGIFSLPTEQYTTVNLDVPTLLNQYSTYKIRLFAFGALSVYEDLLFDYVQVSGDRTNTELPVKLTYFKAAPAGNRVDLSWETTWERNSKEFIIQRSADLGEFVDIGRIEAAGESEGRRQYIYSDNTPLIGSNYYRLRTVDRDNTYEYSKTADILFRPDQPIILVGPNPVTDNLIRLRSFGIDHATLRLTTLSGQSIPVRINARNANEAELSPKSPLAPGVYLLTGNTESKPLTVKVLVK